MTVETLKIILKKISKRNWMKIIFVDFGFSRETFFKGKTNNFIFHWFYYFNSFLAKLTLYSLQCIFRQCVILFNNRYRDYFYSKSSSFTGTTRIVYSLSTIFSFILCCLVVIFPSSKIVRIMFLRDQSKILYC